VDDGSFTSSRAGRERIQATVAGRAFVVCGVVDVAVAVARHNWLSVPSAAFYFGIGESVVAVALGSVLAWLGWPIWRRRLGSAHPTDHGDLYRRSATLWTWVLIWVPVAFAAVWTVLAGLGIVPGISIVTLILLTMGTDLLLSARRIRALEGRGR